MKFGRTWGRLGLKYKNLFSLCSYVSERIETSKLNLKNYISTENMLSNKNGITLASKLPTSKTVIAYKKNDILISNIRPYFKKIWYAEFDGGCSSDVLVLRANSNIQPKYLYYMLSSDLFFNYNMANSKGTKMPRGDKSAIMKYEIPDFSLQIQNKIIEILNSINDKIQLNKQINHHLVA